MVTSFGGWLALIIVGVILLIIGYQAPIPHPGGLIVRIIGWILVAVGGTLFVVWLVGLLAGGVSPAALVLV